LFCDRRSIGVGLQYRHLDDIVGVYTDIEVKMYDERKKNIKVKDDNDETLIWTSEMA